MKRVNPFLLLFMAFLLSACTKSESTDEEARSITGEEVTYSAGGITMNGYIAYD